MTRLTTALLLLGAILTSGCGEPNYGRSSEDPPGGPWAIQESTLHFKHPISLTSLHRVDVTSANHPDILRAGVRRGLSLIPSGGPGIMVSTSLTYETERKTYEFDLVTGTVARQIRDPRPMPDPTLVVKAPDRGGDRTTYIEIVTEMQDVVSRMTGGWWDWMTTAGPSPYELRRAAAYLQSVLDDVERAGPRTTTR